MDAALSTMQAADAWPAHLSWTALTAKAGSPSFQEDSSWLSSSGKLVTKWTQISTPHELDPRTPERGQDLRRIIRNSVPDSGILKSAHHNQSELQVYCSTKPVNASTHRKFRFSVSITQQCYAKERLDTQGAHCSLYRAPTRHFTLGRRHEMCNWLRTTVINL